MQSRKLSLTPIAKITTAESVAHQLLAMIRQGGITPGDRLPTERELMETLAVGRSSVREALQILSTLNVIESAAGQGTFVKEPKPAEVLRADIIGLLIGNSMALELLEAREMIEPRSIRLVCIRGTDDDFAKIEQLLDEHEAALRAGRPVSEFAARFHVMLAEASHNRVVARFMDSILEILRQRGRKTDNDRNYARQEIKQHRHILDLVRRRDPDRAAEALLQHIIEAATTYDTASSNTVAAGKSIRHVSTKNQRRRRGK
ncbi:MAG: FadR/GntR family transcriptional regulator [Dongiaceae bacterium]